MEDDFLTQLLSKKTREAIPLDLSFMNKEKGLVHDVTAGSHLGHYYHEMIEFSHREVKERC